MIRRKVQIKHLYGLKQSNNNPLHLLPTRNRTGVHPLRIGAG